MQHWDRISIHRLGSWELNMQWKGGSWLISPCLSLLACIMKAMTTLEIMNAGGFKRLQNSFCFACVTFILFKASALWADAFYKSKCPSVYVSVRVSVCVSVRLFTFEVPFKRLFAPTSQSRMSKLFRDSESLGKSNGNKLNIFVWKWSKIAAQKKFFFADFAVQNRLKTVLPDD